MTAGEKIQKLREGYEGKDGKVGISQTELGELVGVTRNTVWAWEKGKSVVMPDRKKKLAEIFKVPIDYFRDDVSSAGFGHVARHGGEGFVREPVAPPGLSIVDVPIVGRVAASGVDYAPDDVPRGALPFPMYGPVRGGLQALQVSGPSQEPTAPDGSFIIVKSRDFFRSGKMAVVRVDGQVLLKRVVVDGDSLILESDNKRHRPCRYAAKKVEILAVVHQIVIVREP